MKKICLIVLIFIVLLSGCAGSQASEAQYIDAAPAAPVAEAQMSRQAFVVEEEAAAESMDFDDSNMDTALASVSDTAGADGGEADRANQPQAPGQRERAQSALNRKIIYNAMMSLRVEDPRATGESLQALAASYGGYISSANIYQVREDLYQGTVQLRVNAEQFEAALEALRALGTEVLNEQRDSQDVTDRYVDLTARIENLERTEKELQELLTEAREKSRKVEDVLQVYRELTNIREQIEVYQGQLNLLSDAVSLATIDVELIPPQIEVEIIDEGWNPMRTFRSAIRNLTEGGQTLVDWGIIFVFNILPALLLLALIGFAFRSLRDWLQARRPLTPKKNPPTPASEPSDE